MTGFFFSQVSPIHTFVLCVVMRVLMGFLTGLIFKGLHKVDKTGTVCYLLGGLSAPVLNTLLFMGYIVLVFYNSSFIQDWVTSHGAPNPLAFVAMMVGVQGTLEAAAGLIVGGGVGKGVAHALKM